MRRNLLCVVSCAVALVLAVGLCCPRQALAYTYLPPNWDDMLADKMQELGEKISSQSFWTDMGDGFSGTGGSETGTTSSQGVGGTYSLQKCVCANSASNNYGMGTGSRLVPYTECPEYITVGLTEGMSAAISAKLSAGWHVLIFACGTNYYKGGNTIVLCATEQPLTVQMVEVGGVSCEKFVNATGTTISSSWVSSANTVYVAGDGVNLSKDGTDFYSNSTISNGSSPTNANTSNYNARNPYIYGGYYVMLHPDGSASNYGGGDPEPVEPTYPSDNPDYPTPTTYTEPDTSLPTVGTQTTTTGDTTVVTDVDLGPVTARQDATNGLLYGIGSDLGNMYNMVWTEFDQLERVIYDLGDYLGNYLDLYLALFAEMNGNLGDIESAMANLDQDTDAVDLSGINTRLDALISSLGGLANYDDAGLIASITGSGGSDLFGLYGRLDSMLSWLDSYVGYDDTNLLTTIENSAFDDSSLINAITGSHGVDVLGLFGRIDSVLNWLDTYTGFDDSDLLVLVENIYDTLNNLQDEDTAVTTIRGDVRLIADRLAAVLQDFDNLLLVLEDWPDYPITDLTAVQTYLDSMLGYMSINSGGRPVGIAEWLSYIDADLASLERNFLDYWVNFRTFVTAWEDWAARVLAKLGGGSPSDPVHYPVEVTDPDTGTPYWIVPTGPSDIIPTDVLEPSITLHVTVPFDGQWIQDAEEKLIQKFPFSALPKIAELYGYIRRPAAAPVFDIPVPNPSDWSSPHLINIDLSQFDVVASVLRMGLLIWWIGLVANRTVKMWTGDKQ